jgi:signal peptidase II
MRFKYAILLTINLFIISLDQFTKYLIVKHFKLGETIAVLSGFFNLTYVQNKGAAFGLLAQAHPAFRVPFFIIVPLIALTSMGYVFYHIATKNVRLAVGLSLILAGALGNLTDRIISGYVVDFLDFHWHWEYHFPAFNVADSAICIGVGILMLDLIFQKETNTQKKGTPIHASSAH